MMRQGHNNKRMRGRSGRKGPNPLTRSFESNGPDVKIRGTALHIAEKYSQLARDAHSAGDRVAEQNYLQHAEHYYRIAAAAQAQMPQPQPVTRGDEDYDDADLDERGQPYGEQQPAPQAAQQRPAQQPQHQEPPQSFGGGSEPQPYVNGGPFNGYPRPEMLDQPARQDGESDEEGEYNTPQGAEQGQGEQPMYRMRRRRGRGRMRRQEGGEGGAPGEAMTPPPPVPAED